MSGISQGLVFLLHLMLEFPRKIPKDVDTGNLTPISGHCVRRWHVVPLSLTQTPPRWSLCLPQQWMLFGVAGLANSHVVPKSWNTNRRQLISRFRDRRKCCFQSLTPKRMSWTTFDWMYLMQLRPSWARVQKSSDRIMTKPNYSKV